MSAPSPKNVLAGLLRAAGHPDATPGAIELTGAAPVLPSSFAVDAAAQATIAAAALAASDLWRLRTGRRQRVSVDMRSAAIEFRSERYLRLDGSPPSEYHDPIAGLYRCGDGRWVRLHTNLPHHRDGVLALLGCSHDRDAVQRALDQWRGEALETAAADAGLVVTACRSFAEWDEHPQGRAIAHLPLLTVDQIGDAPAQPLPTADRPLAGVKVLDLTRIISHPRRTWSRRVANHSVASSSDGATRYRHRTGEIVYVHRFAPDQWARDARFAGAGSRHLCARLPARRHRGVRLRPARCRKNPARDSLHLPLCLRPRRPVGRTDAGSTRWYRRPAASMPPKRRLLVQASQEPCRHKCWTTLPVT